jgi:outer membrane protein assembly factor BamA
LITTKRNYIPILFCLWAILSGCLGTKHLKENEKLLFRQSIDAPKQINQESLRDLYAQRPNRKLLGLPIATLVGIYYFGEKRYDQEKYVRRKEAVEAKFDEKIANETSQKKTNKYLFRKQKKVAKINSYIENGNLWMQWGEPLSVYDSSQVTLTNERFSAYLFAHGYFNNSVSEEITSQPDSKLVRVRYKLFPGTPYFIDSVAYAIQDTTIMSIVRQHTQDSYVVINERYDQDNFTNERERIDLLLKDYGYYDFSRQYIDFQVDTTFRHPERKVAVILAIKDPAKRGYHKQFQIDTITFTTDVGKNIPGVDRTTSTYRDVQYKYYEPNYHLKTLSQRVFIHSHDQYSRTKTLNTQRQLGNVDAFKFVNINYDTTGGKFIANIFASPLARYEWTNEAGVNVTQGFPGPFYSISFKKRNIFHGMETLDLSGRFGFEGVAAATQTQSVYQSTEAGINVSLTFPQFIFPLKEERRIKIAEYNPKTKYSAGYSYTDRPEYRRTLVSMNGTYTWQNKKKTSFSFTPISIGVIDTSNLSDDFKILLAGQQALGNNSLINSFRPSFVNSMTFAVTWNFNNYGNNETKSSFIRAQIESGGTIWNFIDPQFITDFGLEYFKFIRLSLDLRHLKPLNKNTTLAYRFNSGFAYSYSDNKSLPYEKFYFAGGSNSIRAWRPRRLGPGATKPTLAENPGGDGLFDYAIEKPSEILMEASVELRQKLFGFVNGAVFIDAGNVWNFRPQYIEGEDGVIREDNSSQFSINRFYNQIGIGTGFGLRFDFTFLILRLDVGMKVYDPARDRGERFVLDKVRFWSPYASQAEDGTWYNFREPVIYNVGIGFPF